MGGDSHQQLRVQIRSWESVMADEEEGRKFPRSNPSVYMMGPQ